MALKYQKLKRTNMRNLMPFQSLSEHGIVLNVLVPVTVVLRLMS